MDIQIHTNHGFPSFYSTFGSPTSDALGWIRFGHSVSIGAGTEHYWGARRPLYGYILGSLFSWVPTTEEVLVAQLLNIALSSATVGLVYLAGARVIGRTAATAAALWICFDYNSLMNATFTSSETTGAFFTAWHLAILARAREGRWQDLVGSGAAFAAANLSRTLSLFALPTHCLLLVVLRWRASGSWRRAIRDVLLFGTAASALILGAMARNQIYYGVFTISDNTASILYAATSPQYGQWSNTVEEEANREGIFQIKDRYRYYMQKVRTNLAEHSSLYFQRVVEKTQLVMKAVLHSPFSLYLATLVGGTILVQGLLSIHQAHQSGMSWLRCSLGLWPMVIAWTGLIFTKRQLEPTDWIYPVAMIPVLRSLIRNDVALMHANLWFFSILGVSGFGEFGERFHLLFDFILAGLLFGGIAILMTLGTRVVLGRGARLPEGVAEGGTLHGLLGAGVVAILALGFLGIPSERIPDPIILPLTPDVVRSAVDATLERMDEPTRQQLRIRFQNQGEPGPQSKVGDLLIVSGRLIPPLVHAPPNASPMCSFESMKSRSYARQIATLVGMRPNHVGRQGDIIFADQIPREWIDQPVVIVAIEHGYDGANFAFFAEGLAIIPWKIEGESLDPSRMYFSTQAEHLRLATSLVTSPTPGP
jgi:hypothetical protein